MSEATNIRGDNTAGNSDPSHPATPAGTSGSRSSRRSQLKEKFGKKVDRFKRFFTPKEEESRRDRDARPDGEGSSAPAATSGIAVTGSAGTGVIAPQGGGAQEIGETNVGSTPAVAVTQTAGSQGTGLVLNEAPTVPRPTQETRDSIQGMIF